jgi:hypothetical protein
VEQFHWSAPTTREEVAYTPSTTFVISPLGRVLDDLSKRVDGVARQLARTLVVEHHPRIEPGHNEIARVAHEYWRARVEHNIPGTPEEDWLQARMRVLADRRGS